MKKILLATTFLIATFGSATAEVTIGGSGLFGVLGEDNGAGSETTIFTRLRFNIDARTETDSGVVLGGRIRMQSISGEYSVSVGYAQLNAAMLFLTVDRLRVEVGNASGAYGAAGLLYNCEIGLIGTCFGGAMGPSMGYESLPYGSHPDRMGMFVSYSAGNFTGRLSYHDTDQLGGGVTEYSETSASADWSSNGLSVSAAAVSRNMATGNVDHHFVGVAYAPDENSRIGLNYFGGDPGERFTIYGDHTLAGGLTLSGYVSDDSNDSDTAIGIGASYSLGGGAAVKASYNTEGSLSRADFGISFSF